MEIGVGESGKGKVISIGEAVARIVYLKGVPENPFRRNTFHNQRGPFWSFGNVEGPLPTRHVGVPVTLDSLKNYFCYRGYCSYFYY